MGLRPIAYSLKLAEGEGLLRPAALSLRENAVAFLSLADARRPNPRVLIPRFGFDGSTVYSL